MGATNWQAAAMIIAAMLTASASLLGPSLAVVVKARIDRAKASPETNQAKDWSYKIGFWIGTHAGRLLIISLAWSLSMLAFVTLRFPLSKLSVILITLDVTMMMVQMLGYLSLIAYASILKERDSHFDTIYDGLINDHARLTQIEQAIWPSDLP